jgi:predicted dehydrogenase
MGPRGRASPNDSQNPPEAAESSECAEAEAVSVGVAIVGCGLVGRKRAKALAGARLVVCADVERDRAQSLAAATGAEASDDWRTAIERADVDVVIAATTNDSLAEVTRAALDADKHVLVEKPAARDVAELHTVIDRSRESRRLVRVGFNHRYHPAVRRAHEIVADGALGALMFLRGRYGHGGRLGYEQEWRADPVRSGGGELIDQGVHLVDLARWFLGDFPHVDGLAQTCYWNMPVDDNAFLLLRTAREQTAFLHVSCTEWKNLFSLEIYGRQGKLQIDGLGGSYGVETLVHHRMLPEMGPPETTAWKFPGNDQSWEAEFSEFLDDIKLGRQPSADLQSAKSALVVVGEVYRRSGYDFARR